MSRPLIIATRESRLALWQTEHVRSLLLQAHGAEALKVELLPMTTKGDQILDKPLAAIGGKGLFLKELEQAMLAGEAHLAVHSMKDIPVDMDDRFTLCAILPRADSADAFVSNHHANLAALPQGARVGTSSLRRRLQLLAVRPDLEVDDLRGNVDTRLRKLDEGQYDAIILAAAGLQRLELHQRIRDRMVAPEWLPAPAQAAIAVQCLTGDEATIAALAPLHDHETAAIVNIERRLALQLQADCHTPFGAFAQRTADGFHVYGLLGDAQGVCHRAECALSDAGDEQRITALAEHLKQAAGVKP